MCIQWSALSPLLYVVVMDVFPREASSGIHFQLLYADDFSPHGTNNGTAW